jgi:hypothetical protein
LGAGFDVIRFGTTHAALFGAARAYDDDSLDAANK